MRRPVFEVDFRRGSLRDKISGALPTHIGTPKLIKGNRGLGAMAQDYTADVLEYSVSLPLGTYSAVFWCHQYYPPNPPGQAFVADFRKDGGTGFLWLGGVHVYNFGSGDIYVNNTSTDNPEFGQDNCVIGNGMDLEATTVTLLSRNNIDAGFEGHPVYYLAIYEGTLTAQERNKLYQDFLHAGPIHQVQRPKLWVPPSAPKEGCIWEVRLMDSLTDLTGNGYNGTHYHSDPTVDGVAFNGVDSYVDFGSDLCSEFDIGSDFSIDLYFKATQSAVQILFNSAVDGSNMFSIGPDGFERLSAQVYNGSTYIRTNTGSGVMTLDAWHFVTVSWDSSSSTIRLFLDGEEHALTTAAMLAGSANQALLGARHTGGVFFKGTIAFAKGYSSQSSLEDHQDRLSKIARQPSLIADGRNARADEVSKTAGEKVIF